MKRRFLAVILVVVLLFSTLSTFALALGKEYAVIETTGRKLSYLEAALLSSEMDYRRENAYKKIETTVVESAQDVAALSLSEKAKSDLIADLAKNPTPVTIQSTTYYEKTNDAWQIPMVVTKAEFEEMQRNGTTAALNTCTFDMWATNEINAGRYVSYLCWETNDIPTTISGRNMYPFTIWGGGDNHSNIYVMRTCTNSNMHGTSSTTSIYDYEMHKMMAGKIHSCGFLCDQGIYMRATVFKTQQTSVPGEEKIFLATVMDPFITLTADVSFSFDGIKLKIAPKIGFHKYEASALYWTYS